MKGTLLAKTAFGLTKKPFGKKMLVAGMFASSMLLAACNDSDGESNYVIQPSLIVSSESYSTTNTSSLAAYSQRFFYKMPGVNNKDVTATAVVMVPKGTPPAGGWPVVVWAHGTTGVADDCAPSKTNNLSGLDGFVAALLQQGYMVVAPDYEGLGTDGIHPYLNLKSESQSIIYALKASKELVKNTSTSWMVVGHSQGGQAALGAAQYAPELSYQFKGAVAVAPASHLEQILTLGGSMAQQAISVGDVAGAVGILASQNAYASLATAGVRASNPTFEYSQIFDARGLAFATQAETICAPQLGNAFGADIQNYLLAGGSATAYPGIKANFAENTIVDSFLKAAEPGTVKFTAPILVIQGGADTTVPKVATDALVAQMKGLGTTVTYTVKPTDNHGTAMSNGVTDIITFLQATMPSK